ncbi:YlaH-like family protein [Neobacillus sp. YX16]|uniref:YlaH-like family protein n=1 Tax=Neobacillus sp. YX16 TaxID=3047874 RepID=UPI0024C429FD|nr:YlaH-like family protein [Neobacillus sp. YX16]WHZ04706.1 YlaH-like family protein [Neobacillus sp. YX16]
MNVADRLSFFSALYKVTEQPKLGMWLLYFTIVALSILVYKLGFAQKQKLPLIKSILIYIFLAAGCTILTALGIFLPITEGLVVAALILIIYKIRLHQSKKQQVEAK